MTVPATAGPAPRLLDPQIRAALRRKLALELVPGTVLLEEWPVGLSIADLVVVARATLDVWEIKSDGDSLRRLAGQAAQYAKVASRVWLAVGPRFLEQACRDAPSWWGIALAHQLAAGGAEAAALQELTLADEPLSTTAAAGSSFLGEKHDDPPGNELPRLRIIREAVFNPAPDAFQVASMLWRRELLEALRDRDEEVPRTKGEMAKRYSEVAGLPEIRRYLHSRFLSRDWWARRRDRPDRLSVVGKRAPPG